MSLSALAAEITKHAKILDSYIAVNNLPRPSFEVDGPLEFPICPTIHRDEAHNQAQASRTALLDACQSLHDLTAGPAAAVAWPALTRPYELLMLKTLHRFSIPQAVPLEGGATIAEISRQSGLDEDILSRIIKYACSYRIFYEEAGDTGAVIIRHTAASHALLRHRGLRDTLSVCLDERFLTASSMAISPPLQRQPGHSGCILQVGMTELSMIEDTTNLYTIEGGSSDRNNSLYLSAFNRAFQSDDNYLDYLHRPENSSLRSAVGGFLGYVMASTNMGVRDHNMDMLASGAVDWESMGEALVVDVGGGYGHASISIARKYPKLRFIIQDLPAVIAQGARFISSAAASEGEGVGDFTSRISFMAHDMFAPQPQHMLNTDVFMFRFVLHDWPDESVVKILRNLIPAMRAKPGCRVIVMDYILPETGTELRVVEKMERTMDLSVYAINSGKERSYQDWQNLVGRVNGRLRMARVYKEPYSAFGIIELELVISEDINAGI
ncbi:O-methyltransferase-domain-containing protein [Bombardia bombarda]|uniref:O-methyltransferase-domain-containing protein n=1 Tax=Bombardia bombarda TaxID=252184 RepID=A0AA39TGI3_9PEZI|nr:O-methyltransferase-domain-containing protein [Bombardia bombarda]